MCTALGDTHPDSSLSQLLWSKVEDTPGTYFDDDSTNDQDDQSLFMDIIYAGSATSWKGGGSGNVEDSEASTLLAGCCESSVDSGIGSCTYVTMNQLSLKTTPVSKLTFFTTYLMGQRNRAITSHFRPLKYEPRHPRTSSV